MDKFQGRDKDCIIISLVRSNAQQDFGSLLQDWRRINVAMTRSKQKLVLIGSLDTLQNCGVLGQCLKHLSQSPSSSASGCCAISLPARAHLSPLLARAWAKLERGEYTPARLGEEMDARATQASQSELCAARTDSDHGAVSVGGCCAPALSAVVASHDRGTVVAQSAVADAPTVADAGSVIPCSQPSQSSAAAVGCAQPAAVDSATLFAEIRPAAHAGSGSLSSQGSALRAGSQGGRKLGVSWRHASSSGASQGSAAMQMTATSDVKRKPFVPPRNVCK